MIAVAERLVVGCVCMVKSSPKQKCGITQPGMYYLEGTSKFSPLPRRVAVVRQREVSGAQLVDGPQNGDAAVDRVPALDPDQARNQLLLQRVLDACKFSLT